MHTTVTQATATNGLIDRARLARAADWLAMGVAASLPWSTSATGILIALWLLALVPTLNRQALRNTLVIPAAALPVALVVLGVLGMMWGDVSLAERMGPIKSFLRLLAIPLLLVHFRNSERGLWVVASFLVSTCALLAASWLLAIWPSLSFRPAWHPGVPVKDYIIQSSEFAICAFALAHLSISAWRSGRRLAAGAMAMLALVFLVNIFFVAAARSALIVLAVLLVVLVFQRFDWKGATAALIAGALMAGAVWATSPYLRGRVLGVITEIDEYRTQDKGTSSGYRLEFWRKSIQFIAEAPVLGHGTGSIKALFRKAANVGGGASAEVTDQPHNQTFLVAIQLGLVGAALLLGVWLSHLLLFRGGGLVAWLGTGIVVQNIVMGLFNSYLFEFTLGWLYVFGVGVLGGMMLRRGGGEAANSTVAEGSEAR